MVKDERIQGQELHLHYNPTTYAHFGKSEELWIRQAADDRFHDSLNGPDCIVEDLWCVSKSTSRYAVNALKLVWRTRLPAEKRTGLPKSWLKFQNSMVYRCDTQLNAASTLAPLVPS